MLKSELIEIEGIGQGRANALISHFKTISKIKSASIEELTKVKGISETIAQNIKLYFKQ